MSVQEYKEILCKAPLSQLNPGQMSMLAVRARVKPGWAQGPHLLILMTGGWGGRVQQRFIFYAQKNHNFRISLSKKNHYIFLAYPKKSLSPFFATQKNPFVSFCDPKNPSVFYRPQKIALGQSFRPKKNHSDAPVIKICEWGPWEDKSCTFGCMRVEWPVLDECFVQLSCARSDKDESLWELTRVAHQHIFKVDGNT